MGSLRFGVGNSVEKRVILICFSENTSDGIPTPTCSVLKSEAVTAERLTRAGESRETARRGHVTVPRCLGLVAQGATEEFAAAAQQRFDARFLDILAGDLGLFGPVGVCAPKAAGVAPVIVAVVTNPVLYPAFLALSSTVSFVTKRPLLSITLPMTPFLVSNPVDIAVAAAESVIPRPRWSS